MNTDATDRRPRLGPATAAIAALALAGLGAAGLLGDSPARANDPTASIEGDDSSPPPPTFTVPPFTLVTPSLVVQPPIAVDPGSP